LKRRVADELSATVCCGVTEYLSGDDSRSLLLRADSALYSAKAAGPNRLFIHTGSHIRAYAVGQEAETNSLGTASVARHDSSPLVLAEEEALESADSADSELVAAGEQVAV
jgi:hypothetical protein